MGNHSVHVGTFEIGSGTRLALIAGPCVIESLDHCLRLGEAIRRICESLDVPYIFKASYDKANRSSIDSFRGPGLEEGLGILEQVRSEVGVPVLSDIHEPGHAAPAGLVLDILQIPAFLCRQTDLLVAAARTGKPVNIKKGQFMSAEQMGLAVEKVRNAGNANVLLTERGTFFGYGRLVNDFTGLPVLRSLAPVVFDATHSCQVPGGAGKVTGGLRDRVPMLARAAAAVGVDALFLEVHDRPEQAKSDATTVWPLDRLRGLLETCLRIADAIPR
ncbi:MAG: 3-deoxy-8-phosphooctulonate synthase [Phycisphaerae bacterium]|nr:3-deoxy-8-phosphooctulonate synthase [Phycisphaerae bacterium]